MNSVTAVISMICLANLTSVAMVAMVVQTTVSFCLEGPAGWFSISNALCF